MFIIKMVFLVAGCFVSLLVLAILFAELAGKLSKHSHE